MTTSPMALDLVRPQVGPEVLAVTPPLDELLPWGGLRRGETVAVRASTSLALALLARATAEGAWGAVVGAPSLGLAAAAEAGVVLERLALVPWPGQDWTSVVATLLDGVDAVVLRPPGRVRPGEARKLQARARERGAVLMTLNEVFDGTGVRLSVTAARWEGVGDGHGHLRSRLVEVRVEGRGAAARPRTGLLWLPGPDGPVAPVDDAPSLVGREAG